MGRSLGQGWSCWRVEEVCVKGPRGWWPVEGGGLPECVLTWIPCTTSTLDALDLCTPSYLYCCAETPPQENVTGKQSLFLLLPTPGTVLLPAGCLHRTHQLSRTLTLLLSPDLGCCSFIVGEAGRLLLECAKTHSSWGFNDEIHVNHFTFGFEAEILYPI